MHVRRLLLITVLSLAPGPLIRVPVAAWPHAEQPASPQGQGIVGVWRIVEVTTGGPTPSTNDNPWPSLVIFTRKYYSFLSVDGIEPRPTYGPPVVRGKPSDAEKLAMYEQWNLFTGNAGTYDINGSVLGLRPIVGKAEPAMGYRITHEFKLSGDTLWLTSKPVPGGAPVEIHRRLVRLE